MSKKNNNNINNYFSQNIKEFGENFLKYKNPKNIENDAMRVFRDLARRKVDIDKYGSYFLDDTFITILIKVASEKYIYFNVAWTGVDLLANTSQPNPDVINVLDKLSRSKQAYNIILLALNEIKRTRNYAYLYSLVSQLNQFRFDL